jgi:hypothetical protein
MFAGDAESRRRINPDADWVDNFGMNRFNRRRFERFSVLPMYTRISVCAGGRDYSGHVYDVSEGGVRFELDEPVAPGTPVTLEIGLPGSGGAIRARGNVVWASVDPDEPGPTRMAAAFTAFEQAADREALLRHLSSGRLARAA